MNFVDLATAAAHFNAVARELEHAPQRIVETGSQVILVAARSMPGRYEKGWPRLKPETIARKARGDSPLLETGSLRDSFERSVGHHEAWIGSNNQKAIWMELGTSRGVPPRPIWGTIEQKAGPAMRRIARAEIARAFAIGRHDAHELRELLHLAKHVYDKVKQMGEALLDEGDD